MNDRLLLFLSVIRAAMRAELAVFPEGADHAELFAAARFTHLDSALYYAMQDAGYPVSPEQERAFAHSIRHDIEGSFALEELTEHLTSVGIDIMPLKGSVLKGMYPLPDMRYMGDLDILYRGDDDALLSVMTDLGYTAKIWKNSAVHHVFVRDRTMVEMHFRLMKEDSPFYNELAEVWEHAEEDGEIPHLYHMSPRDLYLHLLSHAVKHIACGGTGLRTFYDFAFLHISYPALRSDPEIRAILSDTGFTRLADSVSHIADVLYEGIAPAEEDLVILQGLFQAGIFGTARGLAARTMAKQNGEGAPSRLQYFLSRIFPSVRVLAERYPYLAKGGARCLLYPVFWIRRFFAILLRAPSHIKSDLCASRSVSDEDISNARFEQRYFGIDGMQIASEEDE